MIRSDLPIKLLIVATALSGCASWQLNYNTVDLATSSGNLVTDQIPLKPGEIPRLRVCNTVAGKHPVGQRNNYKLGYADNWWTYRSIGHNDFGERRCNAIFLGEYANSPSAKWHLWCECC
jgi:hypothetical protein